MRDSEKGLTVLTRLSRSVVFRLVLTPHCSAAVSNLLVQKIKLHKSERRVVNPHNYYFKA